MSKYISMLRGINVGGQKLIKMDALRELYKSLGFIHVKSYIQSGNLIFSAPNLEARSIEHKIAQHITENYGFEVEIFVMTAQELINMVANNPFVNDPSKDPAYFHITFLSQHSAEINMEKVIHKKAEGEDAIFTEKAVYLYCPHGYGRTKLNNFFIEKLLNVSATTRNWKTVQKLLEIAQE